MNIAFEKHWLESAINRKRLPGDIAEAIANRPEFKTLIEESVNIAKNQSADEVEQTRIIAERIISGLYHSMNGFSSAH